MVKLTMKGVYFVYIDYYNKLVLNKSLQSNFQKKYKISGNCKTYIKKKKSSNTVTLRAPKHFKVGRNHYHVISRYFILQFKGFLVSSNLPNYTLYSYLKILLTIIKKKKLAKILSLLTSIKFTICVEDTFKII